MKVGDLVTVHPLAEGLYILVALDKKEPAGTMGSLWHLYGEGIGVSTMYEKWIEVLSESR